MDVSPKSWFLHRFRLLDTLSGSQKQVLAQTIRLSEFRRGQRIYLPGDRSDQFFLLAMGVVKLKTLIPDGRVIILAFLYPGDIFGESAVLDGGSRGHLAEVHENAVVGSLDRDVVLHMVRQSPELAYQITRLMGLRVRALRARLQELTGKTAHARVAHALLDLARQYGARVCEEIVIPLRLTHRDLANLVGLRRETVHFVLQDLRKLGLVDVDRRSIRVTNPDTLAAVI